MTELEKEQTIDEFKLLSKRYSMPVGLLSLVSGSNVRPEGSPMDKFAVAAPCPMGCHALKESGSIAPASCSPTTV